MNPTPPRQSKSKTIPLILCLLLSAGIIYLAYHYKTKQPEPGQSVAQPTQPKEPTVAGKEPKASAAPTPETKSGTPAKQAAPKASFDISKLPVPPHEKQEEYVTFMQTQRGEDPDYLKQRFQRAQSMLANKDLGGEKETIAFLMAPREKFCRKQNLHRAYDHAFLDIGFGVTISGPFLVGRMTSSLDIKPGEKVLEIGTGSGYQSSVLAYLTDKVYTIEIIEGLAKETDGIYGDLEKKGYPEYGNITRKADDGYYGWAEYAPFDKIIVTCGIDHIPPDLLKQLKVGGLMVIPVGPPGAQVVLKVAKTQDEQGNVVITREDIYNGRKKVPFVPFTKKGGGTWNQ